MTYLILVLVVSYLLGAFPSGRLIARYKGVDLEKSGSGNIGATNVGRVMGAKAGILVLLVDIFKGCLAVFLASAVARVLLNGNLITISLGLSDSSSSYSDSSNLEIEVLKLICAFLAVLGHCVSIPPFLKGGKGVATFLGVLLALNSTLFAVFLFVFLIVFWISRIVSLSSLLAIASVEIFLVITYVLDPSEIATANAIVFMLLSSLSAYKHQSNIKRLISGTEPQYSLKK